MNQTPAEQSKDYQRVDRIYTEDRFPEPEDRIQWWLHENRDKIIDSFWVNAFKPWFSRECHIIYIIWRKR